MKVNEIYFTDGSFNILLDKKQVSGRTIYSFVRNFSEIFVIEDFNLEKFLYVGKACDKDSTTVFGKLKYWTKAKPMSVYRVSGKQYVFTGITRHCKVMLYDLEENCFQYTHFRLLSDDVEELPDSKVLEERLEILKNYLNLSEDEYNNMIFKFRNDEGELSVTANIGDYCNVKINISSNLRIYTSRGTFVWNSLEKMTEKYKAEQYCDDFVSIISKIDCNKDVKDILLNYKTDIKKINISYTDPSKITFIPKGKYIDEYDMNKYRQSMSVYKFLNKILSGKVPEYDIKCIGDKYVSLQSNYSIHPVYKGSYGKVYSNTANGNWNILSCMRGKSDSYFEIYEDNDCFELFVIIDGDNHIVGRFFKVTAVDDKGEPFVYFDRLYYKNESVLRFFHSYCKENEIIRREHQSAEQYEISMFRKGDDIINKIISVHLVKPVTEYRSLPYIDTVRYGSKKGKVLSNSRTSDTRIQLTNTNGTYVTL